ncbi:hypothetical protein B0H11DRAFT_2202284 [Mycena galericulata]|nr:hypothetical protein B0H11DRAFT_2202284 [Mycena galericulata]
MAFDPGCRENNLRPQYYWGDPVVGLTRSYIGLKSTGQSESSRSRTYSYTSEYLIFSHLRRYRTNLTNTPARPSRTNSADEILGMDTPEHPKNSQSLKEEVQSYCKNNI